MTSPGEIEALEAEVHYYEDRVALLRAKLYRWGLGRNARLTSLEGQLERLQERLQQERQRASSPPPPATF